MEGGRIFSVQSDAYASSRPHYPAELFAWIASQCKRREAAWDCATGNGQAALGLAQHFDWVEATDFSPEQIEHAFAADNVSYSVQPAEQTDFPSASFDLVTVAQALHWFDFDAFWPEVRRTAKPTAFFCAWGYAWFDCDSELDAALFTPVLRILEPFWAGENAIMWRGYRSEEISFPFRRVEAPSFAIGLNWNIEEILCHVHTWSAYKSAMAEPQAARDLVAVEAHALSRFRSSGPLQLRTPLIIAAGPVS